MFKPKLRVSSTDPSSHSTPSRNSYWSATPRISSRCGGHLLLGAADRKRIARCLLEAVVVSTPRDSSTLTAKVHWKGGKVTIIELAKGRTDLHRYVSPPELVELIRKLAGEFTDAQIARILRRKNW